MKLFWKILGCITLLIIFFAYLAFLFILPKKIDLNAFKNDVQKIVYDSSGMTLDFKDAKLITTPILETGINIQGLSLKLPDNSPLAETDNVKIKLSLPNLLILTVRVSQVQIDNLKITADTTADATQYKFMNVIQDLVNVEKERKEEAPNNSFISPDHIRIQIANIKLSNYAIIINDLKAKHSLSLRGNELDAYYSHRKKLKVESKAELFSDEDSRVTLDIDINSVMPKPRKLDKDDETNYRADIGFVNPVTIYRTYNIKTNIAAKLKLTQKLNRDLVLKGFANIENLTMDLSGYRIPESYIKAAFKGNKVEFDTNLYAAPGQLISINGFYKNGKMPKLVVNTDIDDLYFKNLVSLTKAFMDTLNIKNDLAKMKASGSLTAHTKIKTNFKKLHADGSVLINNGSFINNNSGIKDINANIIFDENGINITKAHMYVDKSKIDIDGMINHKGLLDINITSEELPLATLFNAFGPSEMKKSYDISSGTIKINSKIFGTIKQSIADINLKLSNLNMSTKDKSFIVRNKLLNITFNNESKNLNSKIIGEDLSVFLKSSKSTIQNPKTEISIDSNNIIINPMDLIVNKNSKVTTGGQISNYNSKKMQIDIKADGRLNSEDLKQLIGPAATPFIITKGELPVKLSIKGNNKRDDIILQLYADKDNYMTPVNIEGIVGNPTIYQALINFKMNRLSIKDTGMYLAKAPFTDDLSANMEGAEPVIYTHGTIIKLDRPKPVINQFHIKIPKDLNIELCAFKNSKVRIGGKLLIFGQLFSPKYHGHIDITNLTIPELYTTMDKLHLGFFSNKLKFELKDLILNNSDIQIDGTSELEPSNTFVIDKINISSKNINIPKITKVSDSAMRFMPKQPAQNNNTQNNIPLIVKDGSIRLRNIVSPPLTIINTTSDLTINNGILRLNNLRTSTLGGNINGRVAVNLSDMMINARLKGENFDVEKALLEVLEMKDAISGTATFETDLEINGAAKNQTEQMKGIDGTIDFEITDGQLGPFGKLENLILAENIRESEFFQTALGSVINNITSIQTSHFDKLNGHIIMQNGIATISPLVTKGPVMCVHIAGDINIITNDADMKLRARLGSQLADMLGPIAAVNPINLVKATPGLNVAAAKMFTFFCEVITPEEINQIPNFEEKFGVMSTTNFQIVLKGNTQKPLSMIKSFKWLSTAGQMQQAEDFIETLPPIDPENPNASLEELLAKQAEEERLANENIMQKSTRKIKELFNNNKK